MKTENKQPRKRRGTYLNKWSLIAFIIFAAVAIYFSMPSMNVRALGYWGFLVLACGIIGVVDGLMWGAKLEHDNDAKQPITFAPALGIAALAVAVIVIGFIIGMPIFQSRNYANVLGPVTTTDMSEYDISLDDVPMLDSKSAYLLANRKMGTLVDLVSQFTLDDDVNVQINYQGRPVRVIPLKYNGIVKWFTNRNQGIPGYVVVDMQTQSAELVNVEGGIHYAPKAYFNDDLMRHVYLRHMNEILDGYSFELKDDGTPVWIVRAWKKSVGIYNASDLKGIYIVDATTGAIEYYDVGDIPQWVDTAYPAKTIITQYDWYGKYQNGWWNSWLGKRGVVETTKGYNYIAYNDDIYLYTGITSVASDESNIGFIFTNLRTKETTQYTYPSAEEYSAMGSAEGQVQHLGYQSTFPIMVRVAGVPTYCMALKDDAGLIKLYAMVNAEQYQVVATAATVEQTVIEYASALDQYDIWHEPVDVVDPEPITNPDPIEYDYYEGTVTYINNAIMDGYSYYYVMLDETDAAIFEIKVEGDSKAILFVEVGDYIKLACERGDLMNKMVIPATYTNEDWIMD